MRTPTSDDAAGRLDPLNGEHSGVFSPELGEFSNAEQRAEQMGDKETKT